MARDILGSAEFARGVARVAERVYKRNKAPEPSPGRVTGVTQDGAPIVALDGGATVTCDAWSASAVSGDRVDVVIGRDHKARLVENYTRPSTGDEYAVNAFGALVRQVNEIRADIGRFGTIFANAADVALLVADDASAEHLSAVEAEVERLAAGGISAETVTVTQATIDLLRADGLEATTLAADEAVVKAIAVSRAAVEQLEADVASIAELRSEVAELGNLKADKAEIEELQAVAAEIETLDVDSLNAQAADVERLKAASVSGAFASFDAASIDAAKVRDMLAASGWFEQLTVTGDETITGRLTAVEIDGDVANITNIKADSLVLLGSDGLYYALNADGMGLANVEALDAETQEALQSGLHGRNIIGGTVTAEQIDATSVRSALLEVLDLVVGFTGASHIEVTGDRMSFLSPGATCPTLATGFPDYSKLQANGAFEGEVAYIAVEGGNATFYMTKAVIVSDLRFGDWQWRQRDNGNLTLKWIG